MNFLIIAPAFVDRPGEYYDFPLGLAYISSALRQGNYCVTCLNLNHCWGANRDETIKAAIRVHDIDIVCTGGLSPHYKRIKEIIDIVQDVDRNIVTVVGGGIITSEPELMMSALGADIGVIGEGEATIVEIAGADILNRELQDIRGIIYKDKDGKIVKTDRRSYIDDLDTIPYPDYEGFDVVRYLDLQRPNDNIYMNVFDNPRLLPIISSRSCPFNCTFCFHPLGNRYRQRRMDRFFEEVEFLIQEYQINILAIVDELFAFNKERLEVFCNRISTYDLKWIAQLRVDQVDAQSLALMKNAGLFYISYGIESASNTVLNSMKKSITIKQIEQALSLTKKANIGIQGNFIFGDPKETWQTSMETLAWWEKHHFYQINFSALIPYPGTATYKYSVTRKRIKDRLEYIADGCPPVNMTGMDNRSVFAMFNTIFNR